MESVLRQIKQARKKMKTLQTDVYVYDAVVDGCQVRMRFNKDSDSSIMKNIRAMLLSARFDAMLTTQAGG